MAMAQVPRAEDEDDRRVRDRDERDGGERPRADEADGVAGGHEVEQRRRDRADVDPEVEPSLTAREGRSAFVLKTNNKGRGK